jgi:hypothetical protein
VKLVIEKKKVIIFEALKLQFINLLPSMYIEYSVNNKQMKQWQWFENLSYKMRNTDISTFPALIVDETTQIVRGMNEKVSHKN